MTHPKKERKKKENNTSNIGNTDTYFCALVSFTGYTY